MNTERAVECIEYAAEKKCRALIQLGDFGLWPGSRGERYIHDVAWAAAGHNMPLYWITGNHEWHDEIDRWKAEWTWPLTHTRPFEMRPYLYYVPRGARFRLDGVRYGALGGAFSIDKALREPHVSWWPQEEPTVEDVERLGEGALDILLTHDAPMPPPGFVPWLPDHMERAAENTKYLIREAIENTAPRTLIHGHWHHRYDSHWHGTAIYGLGHDEQPLHDNVLLFDAKRHRVVQ